MIKPFANIESGAAMTYRMVKVTYLLVVTVLLPVPVYAYDFSFGESAYLEVKGDLTYSVKYRTEKRDPELQEDSKGNSNFHKWDNVNNKAIARMETTFDAPYVTLFGKFDAFYDDVYTDSDLYPEGTDIDVAKDHAAHSVEALEYYIDLHKGPTTLRVGQQIVEWGEMAAPIFAQGVNVLNMYDGTRVGAAGYTIRDYKVPAKAAWAITEVNNNTSVEAFYSRDFEPRNSVAVVGTFGSFLDQLGWGGPTVLPDKRPRDADDMEQYGAAIKTVFPSFSNLELGIYYAHYFHMMSMFDLFKDEMTYEELDMYGFTLAGVVQDWQVYGEFTYRPDQPAQLKLENLGGAPVGGVEDVRAFNWGVGAMNLITDVFSSSPYIVQFTPMIEVYGGINLDYDDLDDNETLAFDIPEYTAYYMASFTLRTADMIDNTVLTFTSAFTGALHKEENSFHSIGTTLTARIGNNAELMLGYDIKLGNRDKAGLFDYPGTVPDRDALTLGFTWYFM